VKVIVPWGVGQMAINVGRRQFVSALGGAAAAWSLAAHAQQSVMPVVGFLGSLAANGFEVFLAGYRGGLKEAGYTEGRNVTVEYRWADNRYDRLPALADDLVRRRVAVIVAAGGEPVAEAAKAATATIPIIFSAVDDPVRMGLVASFNHPAGNMTGMSILNSVVNSKRLEILHELLPKNNSVGLLISLNIPDVQNQITDAQAAARTFGLDLHILNAADENDFDAAFANAAKLQIGAVMVHPTGLVMNRRFQLVALADHYSIATIYPGRQFVAAGGLISYGIDFVNVYRQAGLYTGRILNGEKPGDLPVQQPTKFDLVVNRKTAKALGLTVPVTLLATADEVME
jgi:putative tryptophan/tyrosine transport system substrate-binding protein